MTAIIRSLLAIQYQNHEPRVVSAQNWNSLHPTETEASPKLHSMSDSVQKPKPKFGQLLTRLLIKKTQTGRQINTPFIRIKIFKLEPLF